MTSPSPDHGGKLQIMSDYYLPWDVMIEILSRLPVISLMRFKCVSKLFSVLISRDNGFKKKHLLHSSLTRAIVCIEEDDETKHVISCHPLSLAPGKTPFEQVGDMTTLDLPVEIQGSDTWHRNLYHHSCDGLFCLSDASGVTIWNPNTREVRKIPSCLPNTDKPFLACYGMAYDSVSDDYKILGVSQPLKEFQFKMYSLKARNPSWRGVKDEWPKDDIMVYNMVALNGTFNWLSDPRSEGSYFRLICLDAANEKFKWFDLPMCLGRWNGLYPRLCAIMGKLCFFRLVHIEFSLWQLEDRGTTTCHVKILFSIPTYVRLTRRSMPLHLFEDGVIMMYEYHPFGRVDEEEVNLYKGEKLVGRSTFAMYYTRCVYFCRDTIISPHMSSDKEKEASPEMPNNPIPTTMPSSTSNI